MNKQIPIMNKIIKFGQLKRNYQLHQSRVKNAKTTLTTRILTNNKTNYTLVNHIPRKPFGNSFNRMIDIQFQNKALLKKLTQKSKFSTQINKNNPTWNTQSHSKLNRNINKRKYFQQYQLVKQNQGLLKRLKQTKPLYQMQKYVSQRKITQQYINSISKFGYKGFKPTKTIIKFQMVNNLDKLFKQSKQLQQQQQQYQRQSRSNSNEIITPNKSNQISPNKTKTKQNKRQIQFQLPQSIHKNKQKNISHITKINKNNLTNSKINKINKINKKSVATQQSHRNFIQNNKQKQTYLTMRLSNNNSSLIRGDSQKQNRSHSNSPQTTSQIILTIPEKTIRIDGKKFILKGKQYTNKIQLQILNCKNKQIGHDFIHQVQIDSGMYIKRFQGRIDVLIQHLRFDKQNQGFFLE